jgi:CBS domain-containing protein
MSTSLHTIDSHSPASEALMLMTRRGVHHLPVVNGERILGLLTSDELLRQQSGNTVWWINRVESAVDSEALVRLAADLPEQQRQLMQAGIGAEQIAHILSSQVDALTRRLLALAEAALGTPPVPYLWLACGSLGRREIGLHSDQDSALFLHDDYRAAVHDDYFRQLTEQVTQGLARCGFERCPGEVMATNPEWRQPVSVWRRYFRQWIETPEPRATMLASNFFDLRPIHGDRSLFNDLHAEVVEAASHNSIFLTHLAANALKRQPPLGFFRQFVLVRSGEHEGSLDLKLHGIIPIVELARLFALTTNSTELGSHLRLKAASGSEALSRDGGHDLLDALDFIAQIRLHHQLQRHRQGMTIDNFVSPDELSALERNQLKDAFAAVRTIQDAVRQRYQTERIGA